ncbi:MFS general substrate transporter [Epithele typhae]|uniref:MFS general substrate transporter n=1 Tax=Epithele typhae TaxID=378194 RepID=UPI002007D36A|nr:MFS general substrate transporter [Epithele typhae]KAH9941583.1 MFS general substrate transporter [Epithele typhae]
MSAEAHLAAAAPTFDDHAQDATAANSSAVDLSDTPVLALPHHLTSDRVRRRSEITRSRPPTTPGAVANFEEIELPVIPEAPKPRIDALASASGISALGSDAPGPTVIFRADTLDKDVEIAPSFPNSLAPSVLFEGETGSSASLTPAQQSENKRRVLLNFVTLCICVFMNGWNDGTNGPMLPRIQEYYHIGYAVVSLIFVCNTIGFISGAVANVWLTDKFGFGKVIVFGSLCQLVSYGMIIPAGPFPLMCIAFVFIGFGLSLQNAHCNGYVVSSPHNAATKLGFLHASYGLGALVSPLVSTQFAQLKHWSYHYIISTVLNAGVVALLIFMFRGKRQEVLKAESGEAMGEPEAVTSNKYKQILGLREVHFLSTFSLIYVGVEVTIGNWSVTFLQQTRHGKSSAGYISSGFFAGLMLGRILLIWLNKKIGERRALFIYALIAIQLEVTVWVVPSLVENAVAVALIGLLLGPMYPILMNHTTKILPRWLLTGSIGYIAGLGRPVPPIVSMMSTMIVVWAFIPRVRTVPT